MQSPNDRVGGGRDDGEACVARARTGGATLLAGGYEYLDPLVQQFVRAWRDFFGVWGSGNVYSTPEGGQGLLYHSDSTDIFIMQLEGEKRWDVCGRLLPNLNEPHGGAVPPFAEHNVPHQLRAVIAACRPIGPPGGGMIGWLQMSPFADVSLL